MSEDIKRISTENVQYALEQLAGFEPSDIEGDDFDIGVNDDQFATMSIVHVAQLGAERIAEQLSELERLRKEHEILSDAIDSIAEGPGFDGYLLREIAEQAKDNLVKLKQQDED